MEKLVGVKRNALEKLLTCSICNGIFDDPINITECLHIFCNKCIRKKIEDEYLNRCPECDVYLGCRPLEKLRPDQNWSSIRETIAPFLTKRANYNIAEGKCRKQQVSDQIAEQSAPTLGRRKARSLSAFVVNEIHVTFPTPMTRRRKARGRNVSSCHISGRSFEKPNILEEGHSDGSRITANPVSQPTRKNPGRPKKTDVSRELDLNVPAEPTTDTASNQPGKRVFPVWLSLVPSVNQERVEPLPEIPHCFLTIRDASLPVSYIKKYVVQKLNLDREDEVAISLFGADLPSDMQLHCLVNEWSKTISDSEKMPAMVGGSAQDFVMVLSYGRRLHC